MSNSLYWHLATHVPGTTFRPAREHNLIALAGIEVADNYDEGSFEVFVWASTTKNTLKLIGKLDEALKRNERTVSLYGRVFGCPVMVANCFRQDVRPSRVMVNLGQERVLHHDIAEELCEMIAPDNNVKFDDFTDVLGLPVRPPIHKEMSIGQIWETDDPKLVGRISQRLVIDCCFIALMDVRRRWLTSAVSSDYRNLFEQSVLGAAGEKVSMVKKIFEVADVD